MGNCAYRIKHLHLGCQKQNNFWWLQNTTTLRRATCSGGKGHWQYGESFRWTSRQEQAGGTKQHTFTTSVPRDQDEHSKGGKRSHTPRDGCDLPVAQLALGEPAPRIWRATGHWRTTRPVLETARKKGTEDFLEDCPIQDAVLMRNDDTLIRRWSGGKQRIRFYFKVFGQSSISSGLSCHTKHQK